MKKLNTAIIAFILALQLIIPTFVLAAAQQSATDIIKGIGSSPSLNESTDDQAFLKIITSIITTLLSIMGIILLGMIIYSGFQYMNAGGDSEATETARTRILNATIGIFIVMVSYALTTFIISLVERAASGSPVTQ